MPRKVVDIFVKKEEFREEPREKKVLPEKEIKPKFSFLRKARPLFFLFVLLFSFFVFSLFKFSSAKIEIWPSLEEIQAEASLTIDTKAEKPDFENKIIPGRIFEDEEIFSEEFSASGRTGKKAEGVIRLFNSYTTQEETWLAGTRFISSEGKIFKSKDKIIVPGAQMEKGKIKPSFVDVPVEAAEPGSDYNLPPTKFSVLAFRGTPRFTKYYGESYQPMKGGGESPQVTKEDLEGAEKALTQKLEEKAKEILKNKVPKDFTFADKISNWQILEKNSSVKEGEEKEKFVFQIRAKFQTFIFPEKETSDFAKKILSQKIPQGKKPYFESLKNDFSLENQDLKTGKATLLLKSKVKIYSEIDLTSLKNSLAGKSLTEAKTFLQNHADFRKIKIESYPAWFQKIPNDTKRIEIVYPLID